MAGMDKIYTTKWHDYDKLKNKTNKTALFNSWGLVAMMLNKLTQCLF